MSSQWNSGREWLRAAAYLACIAACAVFYAAISYHAYQSFTWANGGWYGELARAFQQGQVALLSKPSPELLADPDPFAAGPHNYPFKWDISYFHGKYYAYFGPAPAVLFFYPWLLLTGHTLNQALCFWFVCVEELVIFALFLAALVRLYFPSAPIWAQALVLAIFGLGYGQGLSIHFITIHNLAQETGLLFLMAMLYLIFLALHAGRGRLALLTFAATCWGIAVASRALLLPYGWVFLPVLYYLLKDASLSRKAGALLVVMLPPMIIGAMLAWYNAARFGHPLDFGMAYQLEYRNYTPEPSFRLQYFPIGLSDILFMPPRPHADFPFFFPEPPWRSFFNPRLASGPYVGVLFTVPILIYGLFPLGPRDHSPLRLYRRLLLVSGIGMLVLLACYNCLYYRYFMDFLTPFFLLMAVGLLASAERPPQGSGARSLFGGAALWTLYMGFALSLIGEINGLHNFHTYPPPPMGELWLPDGETTQPHDQFKY